MTGESRQRAGFADTFSEQRKGALFGTCTRPIFTSTDQATWPIARTGLFGLTLRANVNDFSLTRPRVFLVYFDSRPEPSR